MAAPHVVVGLSGGVDSSVAAWLLLQKGYRVSALFMVNWTEDEEGYCTSAQDYQDARAVCDELGIELHRADFSREYRDRVFRQFLADYASGRTPNPDVLCNREVKFQPFRDYAMRLGADRMATGHYARLAEGPDGPRLLAARDANKDQTYFLATVDRALYRNVLFPVGELTKPQVRELARDAGLPNHRKRDSTGICFIGERPMREFLSRYLPARPGPIEDGDGTVIGEHPGLMYFTLGQRRGIRIGGRRGASEAPWYVIGKDTARNVLKVSQDKSHPALFCTTVVTAPFHFLRPASSFPARLHARVRHRQALQECSVRAAPDGSLTIDFAAAQRAVAPGQYAVLYDGEECLGGGQVEQALSR